MEIFGISNHICALEALGFSKCFRAYADNCSRHTIECIGFNHNSGYVYIVLENGIQIASCLGQDVEYIYHDLRSNFEEYCDTYQEAERHI